MKNKSVTSRCWECEEPIHRNIAKCNVCGLENPFNEHLHRIFALREKWKKEEDDSEAAYRSVGHRNGMAVTFGIC